MNYDEFAFFNQQLAAMLRDGIPLEGALKQLCAGMRDGPLRTEISQLEQDLAAGVPLNEALSRRSLPPLYLQMVRIGARGNDLPGTLILLADHYQRANALWSRLKGLMVYPLIVICVSLIFSLLLSVVFSRFLLNFFDQFGIAPAFLAGCTWIPPVTLALAAGAGVAAISSPAWRARLRWRLPAFREASLAQVASALALLLKNGVPLADALALAEGLESATPAAPVLARWKAAVQAGQGKPSEWSGPTRPFPPLFLWLVRQGGEDLAAGFQRASDIYQARAGYRIEMALYGVLPISILFLGQMIFWQVTPILRCMIALMQMLGDAGS